MRCIKLETLLGRLKMEHLGYHVESLLEQAAKELNYREFLCMALRQQEWNGRHQRSMESRLKPRFRGSKRWSSSTSASSQVSIVRSSVSWPGWHRST